MSAGQPLAELSDMKGKYVLLSFWASYDAHSRMQNASLSNVLRSASRNENVEMVSVSFDEYQSIFKETVRKDQIVTPTCFVETKGEMCIRDSGYAPQAEASIRFNDETIGIDWPVAESQFILSEKDGYAVSFKDAEYFE